MGPGSGVRHWPAGREPLIAFNPSTWSDTPTRAAGAISTSRAALGIVNRLAAEWRAGNVDMLTSFPPIETAPPEERTDKPAELYIDEVGVAEGYRRRGIARAMLEAMLAHGKAIGCEEAWVGTEPDNLPARALYDQRRAEGDDQAEEFVMYVFEL